MTSTTLNTDDYSLFTEEENGQYSITRPISLNQICSIVTTLLARKYASGEPISSPANTADFLKSKLGLRENELFGCLFLNNQHQVLAFEELFYGTINAAHVHPRVVIQRALHYNAAAVILAHNHPSGLAEPSQADIDITKTLKESLRLVDIRLLDHLIVAGADTTSLVDRGLLS